MEDYPQPPTDQPDYYGQTHRPAGSPQRKKPKKKMFIVLGVVLAVLLLAATIAFFLLTKPAAAPAKQTASKASAKQSQLPAGVQTVGNKYTYKSEKLKIGITFPKTWTLRESSDKQELVLTSPRTTYVQKDNTSTEGVFTIKMRNGIIPQGIKNTVANAVAVADSEVIAYSQPTTDQRQYTNLSYVGPDANNFSFAIITGYTSYKAGQAVGGGIDLNGQAYLFGGGYGADAGDTFTFEQVPKADYNTDVFKQAVEILESVQLY